MRKTSFWNSPSLCSASSLQETPTHFWTKLGAFSISRVLLHISGWPAESTCSNTILLSEWERLTIAYSADCCSTATESSGILWLVRLSPQRTLNPTYCHEHCDNIRHRIRGTSLVCARGCSCTFPQGQGSWR